MAEGYLLLKWIHVLSATLLFGTGLGTAFHFWYACRSGDVAAIAAAARSTVVADFVFTLPAAVVQPATGLALASLAGYPLTARWLVLAMLLYLVAAACWIPVVFIQMRLKSQAEALLRDGTAPGPGFRRLYRAWFFLGWPAFIAMIATLWLMVSRPA
jgi:uncharacterized membrane protein